MNAGRGFVFISHVGEVFPSGFLPMLVGDVRNSSIVDIYRTSPQLVALRDPDSINGACASVHIPHGLWRLTITRARRHRRCIRH